MSPFTWIAHSRTDCGLVRKHNEDAFLERADLGLWAVADGMGGHSAGDLASSAIVRRLEEIGPQPSLSRLVSEVEDAVLDVNARLRALGAQLPTPRTIGSTVAVLLLHGEHAVCLWAGDSRVYRLRTGRLERFSQDHALVEVLVEHGYLERESAVGHPQANLVTRAVGASDVLKLDLEIAEVADRDVFILCSDGLDKEVSEAEIRSLTVDWVEGRTDEPVSEVLVALALSRGARDNVTVTSVLVRRPGGDAAPAPPVPGASPDPEARAIGRSELRELALRHARDELHTGAYLPLRASMIDDIVSGRRPILRRDPMPAATHAGRVARGIWGATPRSVLLAVGAGATLAVGAVLIAQRFAPDRGFAAHLVPAPATTAVTDAEGTAGEPDTHALGEGSPAGAGDWFESQPPGWYTLQLFTASEREEALDFVARFPELRLKVQRSESTPHLYRVVHGSFASSEGAERAADRLPAPARAVTRPFVRPFAYLRGTEVVQ